MNVPKIQHRKHGSRQTQRLGISLLLCLVAIAPLASSQPTHRELNRISDETPIVEKPARAAELIKEVDSSLRQRFAIRVVRIFLKEAHSLAPSLVGAIAASSPDIIVEVASEAVQLFPESAYSIVKAAVAGAPEKAVAIAINTSVQNVNRAEQILAGTIAAEPSSAPQLMSILEEPQFLERTETESSLIFRGRQKFTKKPKHRPSPKPKKKTSNKGKNHKPKKPSFDPTDLPLPDSVEISQNDRGVWIIEIEVPKGRNGNKIAQSLRKILKHLLSHPRLHSKYKIVIHRYTE